jgi:Tfp pilus assembly protein PilF
LCRRSWEAHERLLGAGDPRTLTSLNNLAAVLVGRGAHSEGEQLLQKALEDCERLFGPDHPSTLACAKNLGYVLWVQGDFAQAEPLLRRVRQGARGVEARREKEAAPAPSRASDIEGR